MAEFRKITEVEEVEKLTGNEKILVNDDGTLKQISKDNAKFGGGGVTVFTVSHDVEPRSMTDSPIVTQSDSGVSTYRTTATYSILKEDGTETTAQEIYDAFMSGSVILKTNSSGELQCCQILSVVPLDESGNSFDGTNVAFIVLYYASGTNIKETVWPASSGDPVS